MDLNGFSRRMRLVARRVEVNSDRLVRKTALAIDQAVVLGTPVDTGRARSNWLVEVGSARSDTIEPYAPGSGRSTESRNTEAALDQGRSAVARYQNGQEIHITNNLPYISKLNDGSSAQAPENFVETAIVEAQAAVARQRIVDED